jgi:hypothetical protein
VEDFRENFLMIKDSKEMKVIWFLFGAVWWTLWLNRNDCIFNNKIISSPRAIIFRQISFLVVASSEDDRASLKWMVDEVRA